MSFPQFQKITFIFGFIVLSGCVSLDSVKKEYSLVTFTDGITVQEAKVIAQKEFLEIPYSKGAYNVFKPTLLNHPETLNYPNVWFVVIPSENKKSTQQYLSVIDKRTGAVARASDWYPDLRPGLAWIFN